MDLIDLYECPPPVMFVSLFINRSKYIYNPLINLSEMGLINQLS